MLHLADIYDPAGLFIDFGTSARLKYTLGNWNSGWQAERREGGATVSTFAKSARQPDTDGQIKRLEEMLREVRATEEGAFRPFSRQPVVQAILTLISSLTGIAVLQYSSLVNL